MTTRVKIYEDGSAKLTVRSKSYMTTWQTIGALATQCEHQLQDFDLRKRKEQNARIQK